MVLTRSVFALMTLLMVSADTNSSDSSSAMLVEEPSYECHHKGLHWRHIQDNPYNHMPPDAMICGYRNNDMYIARADIEGSLCPGKYLKSLCTGFFPWGNREHTRSKDEVEILCGHNSKWVRAHPNNVPDHAFIGGRTGGSFEIAGEPLYVARAIIDGDYVCGKAYARYNLCYFPYNGREEVMSSCEILVETYHGM